MKQKISICLDEEINNLVNEEANKNGFSIDEFVNDALKEKFNIIVGIV